MSECKGRSQPGVSRARSRDSERRDSCWLPNRHALGRVAGELGQKPDGSLAFGSPSPSRSTGATTRARRANSLQRWCQNCARSAMIRDRSDAGVRRDAGGGRCDHVRSRSCATSSIAEDDERACGDRRDWHATNAAENRTSALRFAIELIEREAAKTKGGGR